MDDKKYSELLEKYYYTYKNGDIVNGVVMSIVGNDVLVDINAKSTAICPKNEIFLEKGQNADEIFEIGKSYDFVINSAENEDGVFNLSHKKVALSRNIEIIKEKFENNEILEGTISNIVKGGIIVNVLGIKGFVPSSQLKINDEKVGEKIELKVLSTDFAEGNFILSNKKVYSDSLETIKTEIFNKVELNMVVKGKVVRLTDFGAFVDIGGFDGLLPLSQISWQWIDKPEDVLTYNQQIDVEIIGIDREKQRISLSLKSLQDNPWPKAKEKFENQKTIKGKVTRIKPFGTFVEIYPMVEGLLSKKQTQQYINNSGHELVIGEEIEVEIKKFDVENQKIQLEIL